MSKVCARGMLYIVIVISEFLERHSKTKRIRAPAYSRALRRMKGVFQMVDHDKLRSDFQGIRGDRVAVTGEYRLDLESG